MAVMPLHVLILLMTIRIVADVILAASDVARVALSGPGLFVLVVDALGLEALAIRVDLAGIGAGEIDVGSFLVLGSAVVTVFGARVYRLGWLGSCVWRSIFLCVAKKL